MSRLAMLVLGMAPAAVAADASASKSLLRGSTPEESVMVSGRLFGVDVVIFNEQKQKIFPTGLSVPPRFFCLL